MRNIEKKINLVLEDGFNNHWSLYLLGNCLKNRMLSTNW